MAQVVAYKVDTLVGVKPEAIVALKVPNKNAFELYVTNKQGVPYPLNNISQGGTVVSVVNTDNNLNISGTSTVIINISDSLLAIINSALQAGDNISELINDAGYITAADIPNATSLKRGEFLYTSGAQIFTLADNYYQVFSVEVQGQGALSTSQYSLISPNQVQILDTLGANDYVVILYGVDLQTTDIPYYTQAEVDALVGASRVINETPVGVLNGINASFTSNFNFVPETLTVFLNGMLQRVVGDYNTIGNNTINLVNSPSSTETILINYTKV